MTHDPQHAAVRGSVPFAAKSLPVAFVLALLLTWQVHSRTGDEVFRCETGETCTLGSGGSWLLTGMTLLGPFVALLGFAWSRRLHLRERLGPFSHRAIPDGEQILEVVAVLAAGLVTYWLIDNGGSIEAIDVGRPNSWLLEGRELTSDQPPDDSVPNRSTWFLIGVVLSAPFTFSLGSMLGREWYGRARRAAQDTVEQEDEVIDLTTIDLTAIESQEHIDDT